MNTITYYSHYNYIFGHNISALMACRCIASSTLSELHGVAGGFLDLLGADRPPVGLLELAVEPRAR